MSTSCHHFSERNFQLAHDLKRVKLEKSIIISNDCRVLSNDTEVKELQQQVEELEKKVETMFKEKNNAVIVLFVLIKLNFLIVTDINLVFLKGEG